MNYLLDVNVLVAWGWNDHIDHQRTTHWIAQQIDQRQSKLLTSSIPEIGFIRVSVQRSTGRISVGHASHVLSGMLSKLGQIYEFLPDDLTGREWPPWCDSAPKTTDAHLCLLAKKHKVILATLDTGIPDAFLIPEID